MDVSGNLCSRRRADHEVLCCPRGPEGKGGEEVAREVMEEGWKGRGSQDGTVNTRALKISMLLHNVLRITPVVIDRLYVLKFDVWA